MSVKLDQHLVLYHWLIPNHNTYDGIIRDISWVQGASVKGGASVEGLKCGGNGRSILGCAVCEEGVVHVYDGVVPTAV